MKRILMSSAFVIALAGALTSFETSSKPLENATKFIQGSINCIQATCSKNPKEEYCGAQEQAGADVYQIDGGTTCSAPETVYILARLKMITDFIGSCVSIP